MQFNAKEAGARIKKLREGKKIKQADLAESIHVSRNYIGMIEKGERVPGVEIYLELADYFEVTLDYLLAGRSNEILRTKLGIAMDILSQVKKTI